MTLSCKTIHVFLPFMWCFNAVLCLLSHKEGINKFIPQSTNWNSQHALAYFFINNLFVCLFSNYLDENALTRHKCVSTKAALAIWIGFKKKNSIFNKISYFCPDMRIQQGLVPFGQVSKTSNIKYIKRETKFQCAKGRQHKTLFKD